MHSLASLTIDAGVLAVPRVDCAKDDAFRYVETLLHWSKLLQERWIAIYVSERASEALIDGKLFPLRNQLKEIFARHGIVEYSVNDIATVAEKLLSLTPSFETHYQVVEVLSERLETSPDVIQLLAQDSLKSELARCITLIAVLRKHCSQPLGSHSLVLREAPMQTIQIRAQIHDIEHSRADIPALPCPPDFFEGDVLVCDDFNGLIECLDESVLLVDASNEFGIELAIRIALFKYAIAQGDAPDWDCVVVPTIGSRFRELCQQICADQGASVPPKILRSIVETIKGQNLQAVHALRSGSGGNAPQTMRGSDKAQRRDIDREFHLHYWDCADGTFELASVVYHNDFSIPG